MVGDNILIKNDGFGTDPTDDKTNTRLEAFVNKEIVEQKLAKQFIVPRKRILTFVDITPTSYIKNHITEMESNIGLDGTSFGIDYMHPWKGNQHLYDNAWSPDAVKWSWLERSLKEFRQTHFTRFTDNFPRLNGGLPGNVSWWDTQGLKAVENNWFMTAKWAKEAGCRGVAIDLETTGGIREIFKWSDSDRYETKSFDQHKERARLQGQIMMIALQRAFSDLEVHLTFGHWEASRNYNEDLSTKRYGLLPAFLDGMYDACAGGTVIYDGFELAYGWKTKADFLYGLGFQKNPPHCESRAQYDKHHRIGYALWIDYQSDGAHPWNNTDFTNNYFTPAALKTSLTLGFEEGQAEVMYLYRQKPRIWNETSNNPYLPQEYRDVIMEVREEQGIEERFTWDFLPEITERWKISSISDLEQDDPIDSWVGEIDETDLTNTGSNRPTYDANGLATGSPAVKNVYASSQYLKNNTFATQLNGTPDQDCTFAAVIRAASNAPAQWGYIFGFGASGAATPYLQAAITSTPTLAFQKANDAAASISKVSDSKLNNPNMNTAPHIIVVRQTNGYADMWVDGIHWQQQFSFSRTGTLTFNQFNLGARAIQSASDFFDGWIADFIVAKKFYTDAEVRRLIKQLAIEYSITTRFFEDPPTLSGVSGKLATGTVTVLTKDVKLGDKILLTRAVAGGTLGHLSVGTITNETSFTITSSESADTSTVAWKILGNNQATAFDLTGPTSGNNNEASTDFTITPNGLFTGTITPTVTGGGSFTPTSRSWSTSAASQTFAYTPTTTGNKFLVFGNDQGIAVPATITYVVS